MPRSLWLNTMIQLAKPVLSALADQRLKLDLPTDLNPDKSAFAPLEAFARTLVGIAPWLELPNPPPQESAVQTEFRRLALLGLDHATNPQSADYMNWGHGGDQPLVDAGFLAEALLRAPTQLLAACPERVRRQLIDCFKQTRHIWHPDNNWLFFSGMVEAALYALGEPILEERVNLIINTFEGWYRGDGVYSDGSWLHVDYYNSFVIHPMYIDLCRSLETVVPRCRDIFPDVLRRARRYGFILERMIAADGTYPIVGRSVVYRSGAFHLLAQLALLHEQDEDLPPNQLRSALTAVMERTLVDLSNYDKEGWLLAGVAGNQANLAESYINRGSLYLASTIFLPLGLAADDLFWSGVDKPWTMKRLWAGETVPIDGALAP